ncbi:MAG: response regulator [Firmicutes bacterium]|nr:response regulator [Bacillota bacterium]
MNAAGMTPLHYLFMMIGILLLVWICLTAIIVTVRMARRDRASRQYFAYEKQFFRAMSNEEDTIYMLLRKTDKQVLYLSENTKKLWDIEEKRIKQDVEVLENITAPSFRRDFIEKWKEWNLQGCPGQLLESFSHMTKDGQTVWYELNVCCTEDGTAYLFRFRENTREQVELADLQQQITKAAMEARYKTDFLSNMSHEIRTPMNGILGMLALTKRAADRMDEASKESKEYQAIVEYLDRAESLSQLLLGLINDILDMSRIESGKLELAEETFDLFDFAEKLRTMFQKTIEEKGAAFKLEMLDFDVHKVIGDELRLSQVVVNFLSNAVKFTPPGGQITLTFRQMNRMEGKVHFMVRVRDTGPGISPEFLKRIFKPFEQETATIAKSHGGSGLGMAIADNMVRLMNGQIVVDSELGKGSDFNVYLALPIDEAAEETMETMEPVKAPEAIAIGDVAESKTIEGMRLLMAEDNEINAEIAISLLEEMGACVERAENGKAALEMFQRSQIGYYDTILMDIQMPEMNGWEATTAIRQLERQDAQSIPIYALSADAFVEDKRRSVSIGMTGHISKPIDFDELVETIGRRQS